MSVHETRKQFLRFALVGITGLAADIVVLYAALALGLGFYAGRACSFLAAVSVTWQLNRRYTFASSFDAPTTLDWWPYLATTLAGGAVNYLAYSAALAFLREMPFLPAIAVAIGSMAGLAINFAGAKFLVSYR